ncbi:MAG: polymer-forming cytoskeletal protein, partial [Myxococcota bacterium]|nr:polymer-forming cytoskeletal protein [Myxococcota bacterium]
MSRGSVLPQGMTLAGEIRGQGDLVIAGTVEGPIAIDGHLTIEPTGSVRGEVKSRALVLRGTLVGHAIADETIRLEAGARMVGDARAERVAVVEGALLRGRITMTGAQPSRRSSAGQLAAQSLPMQSVPMQSVPVQSLPMEAPAGGGTLAAVGQSAPAVRRAPIPAAPAVPATGADARPPG